MSIRLHIGSSSLIGALERYAEQLDLLEVSAEPNAAPPAKRLRRWRESVPAGFHFSVVLPRSVSVLPAGGSPAELAPALEAARALEASWIVLRTPSSVTPSERSRRRLRELVASVRAGVTARIAWETRGVWTPEDAEAFSEELELTLVRDLGQSDAPASPVVYTRLLTLGQQARIGQGAIERVAERLEDASEAFVVVEGRGAPGVARRLRAELGVERGGVSPDEDESEEEDEEYEGDDEEDERT